MRVPEWLRRLVRRPSRIEFRNGSRINFVRSDYELRGNFAIYRPWVWVDDIEKDYDAP